jgi:hypothetical protein
MLTGRLSKRGEGEAEGEEPKNTTAKKDCSSIVNSILSRLYGDLSYLLSRCKRERIESAAS